MDELVFLKLGGSLITDKTRPQTLRAPVLERLADEVAAALVAEPGLRVLVGHGSGSFGHHTASRYGTRQGVRTAEEWRGYADTALVAGHLDRLVLDALRRAGVPVLPVQPSASAACVNGELRSLDERPISVALAHGLVPVLYGDVALDEVRGGTIISTEEIFAWLAPRLAPQRVILAGEVPGVLSGGPPAADEDERAQASRVIPAITPESLPALGGALAGSRGVDVTGGMLSKVEAMLALAGRTPSIASVHIISGLVPGLLRAALVDPGLSAGTRLSR